MRQRRAFTLVEMLVAMALIIFIMVILSEAFVAGLETFRQLKAIGDMEQRLRAVTAVLRSDLAADHFDGRRRLSDPDFWQIGPPREGFFRIWQQGPGDIISEGVDPDGLPSFRAAGHALHYTLRRRGNRRESFFAAPVPVGSILDVSTHFFDQDQPESSRFQDPGLYTSQWAEVAVFLRPILVAPGVQATTTGTAGGVPLYGLYRRVLLAVPNNRNANWATPITVNNINDVAANLSNAGAPLSEISCKKKGHLYGGSGAYPDTLYFNNPTDLTVPERRFGMQQDPGTGGRPLRDRITPGPDLLYPIFGDFPAGVPPVAPPPLPLLRQDDRREGTDLLLADVISMHVSVLFTDLPGYPEFLSLFDPRLYGEPFYPGSVPHPRNPLFYDPVAPNNQNSPAVYDTWSSYRDDHYDYTTWASPGTAFSAPMVPGNTQHRLAAIKITLRVWDQRAQQARQVTLIQDM